MFLVKHKGGYVVHVRASAVRTLYGVDARGWLPIAESVALSSSERPIGTGAILVQIGRSNLTRQVRRIGRNVSNSPEHSPKRVWSALRVATRRTPLVDEALLIGRQRRESFSNLTQVFTISSSFAKTFVASSREMS